MHNSEQYYQTATTCTDCPDRQYDSLNQTQDSASQAISVDTVFKPLDFKSFSSQSCTSGSGSAITCSLYDAESNATTSAQCVMYGQTSGCQHTGHHNEMTDAEYNEVTDEEYNEVTENNNSIEAMDNKLQPPCSKRRLA